jgi:hypothetical protein
MGHFGGGGNTVQQAGMGDPGNRYLESRVFGSANNVSAASMAASNEAARQGGILKASGAIDQIFNSPERQAQYTDFGNALKSYYTGQLNQNKAIADRSLKFSLARSGLTGGSAAVDAGTQSAKEYANGLLQATQNAQGAVQGLKSQDLSMAAGLKSLAANGLSLTQANQLGSAGALTNLENAQTTGQAQSLGDIFGGTAQLVNQQQTAQAARQARLSPYGSPYATSAGGFHW